MSASTAIPTATSNETKFSSSRNSYGRTTTLPVKRIAIIVSPVLLSTVQPILPVYIQSLIAPYTPRAVIHSLCHPLGPLILGPISLTRTLPSYLSRLFQCALLAILPTDTAAWAWAFWLVLASARVLTGFILTRSVGWAAPGWFSHWALYEDSEGFGPGLLAVLAIRGLEGATLPSCVLETAQSRYIVSLWGLAGLTGLFCWLEWAPWTYAHTWLGIVLLQLILAARAGFARWRGNRFLVEDEEWEVEVLHSDDRSSSETLPGAYETPTSDSKAPRHMPWAHAPLSLLASLLAVLVPYLLWSVLVPGYPTDVQLPPVPQDVAALMNILVLTYPRPPSTNVSARVLNETIASYIPFLSDSITLSVFTHASDHPAFDRIKDAYTSSESDSVVLNGTAKTPAGRYMTFYQDLDSHPTEVSGHYLHLAEAFRWGHEHQRGEWIMLVEDDFPVCWGALGWDYIAMILEQLERERTADGRIRYGWVGTGGRYVSALHFL